jgi:hypothetical protein
LAEKNWAMAGRCSFLCFALVVAHLVVGCGGGGGSSNHPATPQPDFSILVPISVTVTSSSSQTITISMTPENGFSSPVDVALTGLPAGVSASPATFTLTPATATPSQRVAARVSPQSSTSSAQGVVIAANASAAAGPISLTVTATSGSISHTITTSTSQADFALAADGSVALTAGSTDQVSVSVDMFNSFTGQVAMILSGLPSGVTASPATLMLAPGAKQTITLSAASNVSPGSSTLTLQGTSGSLSHNLDLSLSLAAASPPPSPPDFSLTVNPTAVSLQAGGSVQQFTLRAAPIDGFAGQVSVSLAGLPAGVSASPSTLSLTPGTPQTITLTAQSGAVAGTTPLNVVGTSGSLSHTSTLALTVTPAADFSLSLTSNALTLAPGGSAGHVTLTAAALNGFTGAINVTLSGLPSGVVAMPSSFTLTPGTPQQISFTAASTGAASTVTISLSGSSGVLTHNAALALTISAPAPDFNLQVNPATLSLNPGGSGQTVSVNATALNGFSGQVNVALSGLPTGITASPASFSLTPGTAQSVSLQASSGTEAGSFSLNLAASSGTIFHASTIAVTVTPPAPDFQLFAGPQTLNVSTIAGQPLTIALIPLNGFSDAATVTISGLPSGVTYNPPLPLVANIAQTIGFFAGGAVAGTTQITITATDGTIVHSVNVNLVVSTPTLDFSPGLSASSSQVSKPMPGLLLVPGTTSFSIYITGVGAGNTEASSVSVQITGLPPGTGIDHSQNTFSYSAPKDVFNITVSPEAVGERGVLQAIFTGPQMNHEVDVPVYILPQPQMFTYAAPVTVQQGSSADLVYEVASTSVNEEQLFLGSGWPSTILLNVGSVDSNPALVDGFPVEIAGAFSVEALGTAPIGGSTLPVEFAVDNLTQVLQVPLQVNASSQTSSAPDFSLNFTPQALTIQAGTTATLSITETPINPPSVTSTFCSAMVQGAPYVNSASVSAPLPLGTVTTQSVNLCNPQPLNITVPPDTPPGNYELTVRGELTGFFESPVPYGPSTVVAIIHQFGIPVTVTAAVIPTPSFTLSPSQSDISLAAGQSFPVTITAQVNNGFNGSILVSSSSVPAGVVVSPANFSLSTGSSQQLTISVATGTAPGNYSVQLAGSSGSNVASTGIAVDVQ